MDKFYSDALQKGIQLLHFQNDESRYPEGVDLIQRAAAAGEADAYYFLARCYAWGDGGVAEDSAKARSLSKEGIEKGSDLCVLGADRFGGLTGDIRAAMKHSLEDSFQAVKKMAEAGEPMAQYAVGLFYFWGDVVALQGPNPRPEAENAAESHKWFRMAAKQGCIPAFNNVYASMKDGVNGIPKDVRAALQYAEEAQPYVQMMGYAYLEISNLYAAQRNSRKAQEWLQHGMQKGGGVFLNELGCCYRDGTDGYKQDDKKAFQLFQEGAQQGSIWAQSNLGECYFYSKGTAPNDDEAFRCFKAAAEAGISYAQLMLSNCYYNGFGTSADYDKCVYWAQKAAKQGNVAAYYFLGMCYLYGKGMPQDAAAAEKCLTYNAEENHNGDAYRLLGELYDKGLGVPADIEKAIAYYQEAVQLGCAEAQEDLARFKKSLFGGKWKRR